MYLSRLYVKNYKSIKELDIKFLKGKSVIIGRNNAGKSNIIKAIDIILGEGSPTYAKSENITDNDFHTWKEKRNGEIVSVSADELFIWCELTREENEELNYDEIYKCYGFYVHSERTGEWQNIEGKNRPITQPIRILKERLPLDYQNIFEVNEDDSVDKKYVNPKLRNQQTFENEFNDKFLFSFAFKAWKVNDIIEKELRFLYREKANSDWILAFRTQIRNEFLQSAIIPSFRDPQNQLRLSSYTWFGRLMKHLTAEHATSDELRNAFNKVKEVVDGIFGNIKDRVTQSSLNVAFPESEIHFQFNADTKMDIYKNCVIYVDDGFKSLLTEKGSGVQSAIIIGLFNYYTQYVNTITSALLCIEEPEVYLHPHARRVISDRLDDFLNNNKNQVILTTHSVEFIRTIGDDLNVILVRKNEDETIAVPVNIKQYKDLLIDNNQNEIFFSDKVIVCEGLEDFIIRAVAKEVFPQKLDENNISVVSIAGKNNFNRFIKLILKLGIKCFIFSDFDYLLRDKMEHREKYGAKAHESIINLGAEFFSQNCIFGENGNRIFSKIERVRSSLKANNEKEFYTAKHISNFPGNKELARLLNDLRQNGVCILDGELEDLSKENSFISSENKLSIEKVYELNSRLSEGQKITDLFEVSEIGNFLNVVLDR